ncbi:HNH endonuclease [Enterococcus sp. AZ103]|uniref:HNH endonuclease n=1 Tax=Enterococcus sp. AZ103 TaxID=2774628 RepID=UPI003F247E94
MIKIKRTEPPNKLDQNEVKILTNMYIKDKKPVWNKRYIKDSLLLMSHEKCAYCEAPLVEPGTYMEVEHFYPKSLYPDKVVDWNNLLPSCKSCNSAKGSFDPNVEPIIDPSNRNPRDYISLKRYSLVGKNSVGKSTIATLNLNDIDRLLLTRMRLTEILVRKIQDIHATMLLVTFNSSQSQLFNIRNTMIELLQLVQPDKKYSATLSSILLNEIEYIELKKFLIENKMWNEDLEELDKIAKEISLDIVV